MPEIQISELSSWGAAVHKTHGVGVSVKCAFQDLAHLQRFCFTGLQFIKNVQWLQVFGGPNENQEGEEDMTSQLIINAMRRNEN